MILNINYIYIDLPNFDNVTMCYYIYFTTLLHVFLHVDNVTKQYMCPSLHLLTETRQLLG